MPESYQDTLKRVRPPRVRIDYKVETEGAEPILELPFVVGIMADLSGSRKKLTGRSNSGSSSRSIATRSRT